MKLNKPYINKEYAEFANQCNIKGLIVQDKGTYLEGVLAVTPEPTYTQLRAGAYPDMTEQLDKLYHDIDGGLFGETAKTSAFYLARKGVKDAYPKACEPEVSEAPKEESVVETHESEAQ